MATSVSYRRQYSVVVFALFLINVLPPASGKWVRDSLTTNEDWKFLTRFCFLSEKGRFNFNFKYPKSYGIQSLLLYYDAPGQWEGVYKSAKNCSERLSVLSRANNQIIDLTNLSTGSRSAGCTVYSEGGEEWYNCSDLVSFRAARERWWYICVARCGASAAGKTGLQLDYEIHMMNGDDDDFLHHEYSADEFYILPVDVAFLLLYIFVLVVTILFAILLRKRQMFHTTYKMYVTALSLWLFGVFLQCIAWGMYGGSGWPEKPTEVTGRLFQAASTTVFILMLLLIAKGFSVTRGRLTQMSTVRLTLFMSVYIIINIILFIWEGKVFDEGYVLYFYESPPGYGLIAVRLIAWLWFLYAFAFTIKHYPQKAKFYIPYFVFYTIWFWASPIVILAAIFNVAKWTREKTVHGVEQFVNFCGYFFFLVLTRPTAANANFPYHLRVSQVQFLDDDEETDPQTVYSVSEESVQHINSLFTVENKQNGIRSDTRYSAMPSSSSRPSNASNGYANGGYMKSSNGYNPALESTFSAKPKNQLPPLSTAPASSIFSATASTGGKALPPLSTAATFSVSSGDGTGGGGKTLPPIAGASQAATVEQGGNSTPAIPSYENAPVPTPSGDGHGARDKEQIEEASHYAEILPGDLLKAINLPPIKKPGALPPIGHHPSPSAPHADDDDVSS